MLRNLLNSGYKAPLVGPLLSANNFAAQQVRTTFILKRKNELPLHKKREKPRKMRGRHFNYELIEDTNIKKQPNIDVILTSYVNGIGRKGEIVNVAPTKAYNELLLPGLATYVTPANIEKYASAVAEDEEEEKHSTPFAKTIAHILHKKVFAIVMNKDQPWVLEPWHIRASLRKAGCYILKDSSIELPEEKITGPDLAKQNKQFMVTVTINNLEKTRIRCRIHHWSTDPTDRLPYVFEHYKQPAEPMFARPEPTQPKTDQ